MRDIHRVGGFGSIGPASLQGFLHSISPAEPAEPEHIANFVQQYGPEPAAVVFPLLVEGVEVAAMLDNGATITVISKRLADLLQELGKAKTYPARETIKIFGGGMVTLTEKMDLNLGTEKRTAKIDAWVSHEVPFDLCIGFNFTRPNNFIVDLEDGIITMFGKTNGETAFMMDNTQILSKLSQLAQAVHARNFRRVLTLSIAQ